MAMMSALSSGVSGLKAQQTSLDVIANNISNMNTTGYKAQTVTFSDLLSQTISSASGATTTTGGTNPMQVGLGVSVASTTTDMSVGSTETTSKSTDVSIGGSGFFIVQGGIQDEYQFTRAGNLDVDEDGNLNVDGYKICGWMQYTIDADGNYVYNTDDEVEAINIYSDAYNGNKQILAAKASDQADFSGNLDPSATVAVNATALNNIGDTTDLEFDQTSSITVFDAQGNSYDITVNWKKCYTDGTTTSWYWETSASNTEISPSSGYVAFDADGKLVSQATTLAATVSGTNTTSYTVDNISPGSGLAAGSYTVSVADSASGTTGAYDITLTDPDGATYTVTDCTDGAATFTTASGTVSLSALTTGSLSDSTSMTFTVAADTIDFDSTPTITVTPTTAGTAAVDVGLDFTDIYSYTSSSTSKVTGSANGYEAGQLQSLSISSDGMIVGTYSNGESQSLGMIALAVFSNPEGLEKIGGNLYVSSNNSGDYTVVSAGSGGSGSLSSYTLELSNVDLAAQFSAMMISQRAYQANSKVISTADEMLQSLINMVG